MTDIPAKNRRIILCASCFADAEPILDLALELARQAGAELQGILVTDETVMLAAGYPKARVLSYSGTTVSQVSETDMRSAFRADARQFALRLEKVARQAEVRAAFFEHKGRLPLIAQSTGIAGDLVILAYRRATSPGDGIVLIANDASDLAGLAGTGAILARATGQLVTVLAPARLRTEAARLLYEAGVASPIFRTCEEVDDLASVLEPLRATAVIIGGSLADAARIDAILASARSPVLVTVSSAKSDQTRHTDRD